MPGSSSAQTRTWPRALRGLVLGLAVLPVVAAALPSCSSSSNSNSSSTTTPSGPAPPATVTATAGIGQVTVSWTVAAGATSYNLYYATTAGTGKGGTKVGPATSPATVNQLTNGTAYFFVVTAVGAAGEGSASAEVGATPQLTVPGIPSGVSATAGAGQATINWNSVAGDPTLVQYNLYYSTTAGTGTGGTKVSAVTSPHTITGLTGGTPYFIVITAVDGAAAPAGESAASAQVSVTPAVPAPTGLAATAGAGQVQLTWTAVPGATSYDVYYGTASAETRASHQSQALGAVSPATLTALNAGTTYYFTVTAWIGAVHSVDSATATGLTVPPPPTGLTGTPAANSAVVTWTAATGAVSYNLYYSTTAGTGTGGTKVTAATRPYTLPGLTGGTLYYVVVTSVNPTGESAASAELTTAASLPAPTGVTAIGGSATATLTWNAVAAATGYEIYYGTSNTQAKLSHGAAQQFAGSPATVTGLNNGTTYYFTVTATNAVPAAESAESTTVNTVTLPGAVTGATAAPGPLNATITWGTVTGATGYSLYSSTTPGTGTAGTKFSPVATPYTLSGLTGGLTYYLVVTATNATGEGAPSAEMAVTPTLTAPAGLAATRGGDSVRLSWTAIAGASGYNLYWRNSTGVTTANGTPINVPGGATAAYVHTPLALASTYYYVLTALTASATVNTEGPASAEMHAQPAHQWLAIANGGSHTLAVRADGTLWAWGANAFGQLGLNNTLSQINPTQVGVATTWVAVAAGADFSLALDSGNALWAWGHNNVGQLGLGTVTDVHVPTHVGAALWSAVGAGHDFALGIQSGTGALYSWGNNNFGQLGLSNFTQQNAPTLVGALTNWTAVAAGTAHALAINAGNLYSWGYNANGELGQNNHTNLNAPTQVGALTWTAVAAGDSHSLGISGGALFAWGYNGLGQLGLGTTANAVIPTQVGLATTWTAVGAGQAFSLALQGNTLWAWGGNASGQLGVGGTADRYVPTQIGALTIWNGLGPGSQALHSAALQTDQSAWVWGNNSSGELGDGTTNNVTAPEIVP